MKVTPLPLVACLLAGACFLETALPAGAEELIRHPGFEDMTVGWKPLYVPEGEPASECRFEASEDDPKSGRLCGMLASTVPARYAVSPMGLPTEVEPGDRFQLTLWVRAGSDFAAVPNTPGFVVNISFANASGQEIKNLYVNWKGEAQGTDSFGLLAANPIPEKWTKLRYDFQAPADAAELRFGFFIWKGQGALYLDDVSLVKK